MKTIRRYEIDWLRIILILSVFIFHIGAIFNTNEWHLKNSTQYTEINKIMSFLHYWRMPMLFFISGIGTYFALGKRTIGKYIKERSARLLIPLLSGIILLVPVQVYIERINQYSSVWDLYLHFFDGVYPRGNFSWHHLWFLVYLFLCSIIIVPFIKYYKSEKSINFRNYITKIVRSKFGLYLFVIPILLSQLLLRPFFPIETHALVNDWAYFLMFFIYFIYGFILLSNAYYVKIIYYKRHGMMILSILSTILMFLSPNLFHAQLAHIIWNICSILLSWFLCISIIGYAQTCLNIDNKLRKIGNEMIYPFYLLHQPVIIVLGYFIIKFEINDFLKFLMVIASSFVFTVALYMLVVRQSKFLKLIFGVKKTIPLDLNLLKGKRRLFVQNIEKAS